MNKGTDDLRNFFSFMKNTIDFLRSFSDFILSTH